MPSLHAKHSRRCQLGPRWSIFDEEIVGCTCPRGTRRSTSSRAKAQARTSSGSVVIAIRLRRRSTRLPGLSEDGGYRPRPNIGFAEWAGQWLESLERKPSTVGSYRSTIAHAKKVFGAKYLDGLGSEDIGRFNRVLRERGCSASTQGEAPSCTGRLLAGSCVLSALRVQPGTGIAAGAQAAPGAQGGGLLRERRTSSSLRATQRRELQDTVLSCAQDRDAARRVVCSSVG